MIEFKFMLALLRVNPSAYPVSNPPSLQSPRVDSASSI